MVLHVYDKLLIDERDLLAYVASQEKRIEIFKAFHGKHIAGHFGRKHTESNPKAIILPIMPDVVQQRCEQCDMRNLTKPRIRFLH